MEDSGSGVKIGFAGLLFLVFLVLKLTGVIAWSWIWVFAPLWISLLVNLLIILIIFIIGVASK